MPIKIIIDKDKVKSRLKGLGLRSQRALAQQSGLDYYNLNHVVNGAAWNSRTLARICEVLECEPGYILSAVKVHPGGEFPPKET
jgi:DNA-binding Xre family transcriptional regulator